MIRALVWKEVREQGVIVAALAVLGVAVLVGLSLLNASAQDGFDTRSLLNNPGVLAVIMLSVTAGAVVGGTLFAAERENGTDAFLALLPVRRRGIWAGKVLGGVGLVLAVTAVLFGSAAGTGLVGPPNLLALWGLGLATLAISTFSWGAVGSIFARTSLAAAGLGLLFLTLASLVLLPLALLAYNLLAVVLSRLLPARAAATSEVTIGFTLGFCVLVLPFLLSFRLYTSPDRDRHRRAVRGARVTKRNNKPQGGKVGWLGRTFAGVRAALWVSFRQHRLFTLVLCGFALVGGMSFLAPPVPFAAVWPPVGLFMATLVGVLGWYDEQSSGSKRFWLERRLPAAGLWWSKLVVGGLACAAVVLCALLPVVVKVLATARDEFAAPSFLLFEEQFPIVSYVLLWPVYGFVFGHATGMLFRKTVVAAAVAVMVGGVAAAAWLPSLLGGGIHAWQLWLPPLTVLALARTLAWACVADAVGRQRTLLRLAGGVVALAGVVAAGLGYRVIEIPDDPARDADTRFRDAEIPPFETNLAGLEIRRAGVLLQAAAFGRSATSEQFLRSAPTPVFHDRNDPLSDLPTQSRVLIETAVEHGWQPSETADRLMADAFANDWDEALESAARLELGTVEDPRELNLNTPLRHLYSVSGADSLLLVRGLKAQAEGDPERFVRDFAHVLMLSRNVRNKSVQACAAAGRRMEQRAIHALPRWLDQLEGREDLVRRVADELARHDAICGDDQNDIRLADQLVLRNTLAAAGEVLRRDWRHTDAKSDETRQRMDVEADLVGFAWQLPWEKERHERLIAQGNAAPYPFPSSVTSFPFRGMPGVGILPYFQAAWHTGRRNGYSQIETRTQAERRAATILVALHRYELKYGRSPETLDPLAPEFLPVVPKDPYNSQPFGYRLSAGERVALTSRTEPPGLPPWSDFGPPLAAVIGGGVAADGTYGVAPGGAQIGRFVREVFITAGRPILWSVGPDRIDDGGRMASVSDERGTDLICFSPARR